MTKSIGLSTMEGESEEFDSLYRKAAEGDLERNNHGPCLSVAVQQIFSMLYQHMYRGVKKEQIFNVLKELSLNEAQIDLLLQHLSDLEYLNSNKDLITPTMKMLDLGERGQIHSNIPTSIEYSVVNDDSGQAIGEISSHEPLSQRFLLSGERWNVVSITGNKVSVTSSKTTGVAPSFPMASKHGKYYSMLPGELKKICCKEVEE